MRVESRIERRAFLCVVEEDGEGEPTAGAQGDGLDLGIDRENEIGPADT